MYHSLPLFQVHRKQPSGTISGVIAKAQTGHRGISFQGQFNCCEVITDGFREGTLLLVCFWSPNTSVWVIKKGRWFSLTALEKLRQGATSRDNSLVSTAHRWRGGRGNGGPKLEEHVHMLSVCSAYKAPGFNHEGFTLMTGCNLNYL